MAYIRAALRYIVRMIALTGCLACCLLAMLFFRQTDFGRLCHDALVRRPVAALAKFRSHHLLYAVILLPVLLSGGEFIALLGPEFFAAYAMELAIYFDAVAVSVLATAYASVRSFGARFIALVRLPLRRTRARRTRTQHGTRRGPQPANDDDGSSVRLAA